MSYEIRAFDNNNNDEQLELFRALRRKFYPDEAPELLPENGRFFLVMNNGEPAARGAALVNPSMRFRDATPGLLGYFESLPDREAAGILFDAVACHFRQLGFHDLIGPINGSTWQSYRVTLPGGNAPFFLDNRSQPYDQELFESNSFETIAEYLSTRLELTPEAFARVERSGKLFAARHFRIRNFRPEAAEEELRRIYELSLVSFRNNFLYTPIPFEPFFRQYQRLLPLLRCEHVLLAEKADGSLAGFLFAVPNHNRPQAGELIVKTLAVSPDPDCRGLGSYLVELFQQQSFEAGCRAVYHALMHADNASARIGKQAEIYQRYRLYGKKI